MHAAEHFLYFVSALLYYPVILGLSALVLYVLAMYGSLAREWLDRRRGLRAGVRAFREEIGQLLRGGVGTHVEIEIERLLQERERVLGRPLERARFVVRAGPGVGLMGTLIPMGIALSAMVQGSMPAMAEQMVHAFNAAVVGLGSGVAAFAVALVREQWLRADVTAMRYLGERALADGAVPPAEHEGGPVDSTQALGRPA